MEIVLAFTAARGWRSPDNNPAEWRRFKDILTTRFKVAPVVHHAALDWHKVPAFMAKLRAADYSAGAR
jgi:hypothetical protein